MKKNLDGKTMPLLAAGAGLAVANTYYSQPMLAELSIAVVPVAGQAGEVGHDGIPGLGQAIEQR